MLSNMISPLATLFALASLQATVDTTIRRQPTLAVMSLQAKALSPEESDVLSEAFTAQLKSLGKFRVMERSQIDKILSEQGFQQSGACDKSECAVEVGRIVGIDQMVVGSVGKLGGTWSTVVRLVSVGTGEILASAQDTREGKVDVLLSESVPRLSAELLGLTVRKPVETFEDDQGRMSSRTSTLLQERTLAELVRDRKILQKKGYLRAADLSDSVDRALRFSLYREGSVSGWWALANIYLVPVGSIVQKDWNGIGLMGIGYGTAILLASRSPDAAGTALFASYIFGIVRPIWFANNYNAKLKNALRVDPFLSSVDGRIEPGLRLSLSL